VNAAVLAVVKQLTRTAVVELLQRFIELAPLHYTMKFCSNSDSIHIFSGGAVAVL
jgi:hypothetical protein